MCNRTGFVRRRSPLRWHPGVRRIRTEFYGFPSLTSSRRSWDQEDTRTSCREEETGTEGKTGEGSQENTHEKEGNGTVNGFDCSYFLKTQSGNLSSHQKHFWGGVGRVEVQGQRAANPRGGQVLARQFQLTKGPEFEKTKHIPESKRRVITEPSNAQLQYRIKVFFAGTRGNHQRSSSHGNRLGDTDEEGGLDIASGLPVWVERVIVVERRSNCAVLDPPT